MRISENILKSLHETFPPDERPPVPPFGEKEFPISSGDEAYAAKYIFFGKTRREIILNLDHQREGLRKDGEIFSFLRFELRIFYLPVISV